MSRYITLKNLYFLFDVLYPSLYISFVLFISIRTERLSLSVSLETRENQRFLLYDSASLLSWTGIENSQAHYHESNHTKLFDSKTYIENLQNLVASIEDILTPFTNLNIIIGRNGIGKTSIIEAIYLGSLAKSFKTNNDR